MSVLRSRLERMYALAPDKDFEIPNNTALSALNAEEVESKLSPPSQAMFRALSHPTKSGINDYDKAMASTEQSVRKALTQLEKLTDSLRTAEAQRAAHEERLKILKAKKLAESAAKVNAAREKGRQSAEQEAAADSGAEESGASESGSGKNSSDEDEQEPSLAVVCNKSVGITECPSALADAELHKAFRFEVPDVETLKESLMQDRQPVVLNPANSIQQLVVTFWTSRWLRIILPDRGPIDAFGFDVDDFLWGKRRLDECLGIFGILTLAWHVRSGRLDVTASAMLSVKLMVAGPNWNWTGFADCMFGKAIACLSGKSFIAAIPLDHFRARIQDGSCSLIQCSDDLNGMDSEKLLECGGFCMVLEAGHALFIPPGHLITMFGACYIPEDEEAEKEGGTEVSNQNGYFLASRLEH